jgi:hypothetical protein
MARIKKQYLGELNGSIGAVVFKQRGNTKYVASKPPSFIPGTDPASIFRRDQGAFVGKLSSKIYSIDIIKKIWSPYVENQSRIYHRIWSENYHAANCSNLDMPAKLAPAVHFIVNNPSILFNKKSFLLKTDPIGIASGINPANEKFILCAGVMVLKKSMKAAKSYLEIIPFKSEKEILLLNSELNFNIILSSPEVAIYMKYQFRKCYLILITLDNNDNPVNISNCLVIN